MRIEGTVSYLLAKTGTAHRNLIEKRAREIGLHGGQIFVLLELWKSDGLRQVDLASRLNLTAATVNRTIGGLMEGDYITRQTIENDARSTRICLTKKGHDIRPQVEALWQSIDDEATGGLTDAEVTMLGQILPRLVVEIM